jgi:hypothetical protein
MKDFVNSYVKITLSTLAAISSSSWISDGLKGDCLFLYIWNMNSCGFGETIPSILVSLAIFIVSTWFLVTEGQKLFYINLNQVSEIKPHPVLIIAVSTLNTKLIKKSDGIYIYMNDQKRLLTFFRKKYIKLSNSIDKDIEAFNAHNFKANTQQLLRAVRPHLKNNTLKKVFLIGSTGENGSYQMLKDVECLLHHYDPTLVFPCKDKSGIRFDDVDALRDRYEMLVQEAKKNYAEDDIILDVTGGQKTASIAAAMTTFRYRKLKFQYVDTGGNNAVRAYNIVAGISSKTA